MAEDLVVAGAEEIVKRLISLGIDEIGLIHGVKKEVEKLQSSLTHIQLVLQDAEKRQVEEERVRLWLEKLKEAALNAEDILEEFAYDGLRREVKVHNFFSCLTTIASHSKTAHSIKNICKTMQDIDREKDSFQLKENVPSSITCARDSTSLVDESGVIGREVDKLKIVDMLIHGSDSDSTHDSTHATLSIIAIVGIGGLGKTTLAQLVFNEHEVKEHFGSMMIWVCVSEDFAISTIWLKILKEIGSSSTTQSDQSSSNQELQKNLEKEMNEKKFLLVLDDFWQKDVTKWEELILPLKRYGGKGSKIIVTTRQQLVASTVGAQHIYDLGFLPNDQCWSLFESRAFMPGGPEKTDNLVKIGREIVEKCGGLPLALKVLGGLMFSKTTENEWLAIRDGEVWESSIDVQKQVMEILKLSYNNLPPSVRRCFSYCSIFPKDYAMQKHLLIQLWMAQGFLQTSKEGDLMEDIGEEFIRILCTISFFEIAAETKTSNGAQLTYKMHDLVHDLAQYLSRFECKGLFDVEHDKLNENLRHLSLIYNDRTPEIPKGINKLNKLRSFYSFSTYGDSYDRLKVTTSLPKLLQLRFLRVLDLSKLPLKNLPSSIGGLKLLKYLDLSWSKIKRLPSTISNLYNLQTFNLSNCHYLSELPKSVVTFTQLRYFYAYRDNFLTNCESPRGLNELTFLQTLDILKLRVGSASKHISELEHLNYLEGTLRLQNLGYVNDVEAMKKANLMGKKNLQALDMDWESGTQGDNVSHHVELLEALEPHSNLKELTIYNFLGLKLAGWITNGSALPNLVKLLLDGCCKCKEIKSLGKLSSLKELVIERMDGLSHIGEEVVESMTTTSTGSEAALVLYPCLEKLLLRDVPNLLEWFEDSANIFPKLQELELRGCPELRSMPNHFPSLRKLTIGKVNNADTVMSITKNITSLTSLSLMRSSSSSSSSEKEEEEVARMLGKNELLESLTVVGLSLMRCFPDFSGLQFLRSLEISDCEALERCLLLSPSLEILHIIDCPQFQGFLSSSSSSSSWRVGELRLVNCPSILRLQLHGFTQLRDLRVKGCTGLQSLEGLQSLRNIESLSIGPFSEELNDFPFLDAEGMGDHLISSLHHLDIYGWCRLKSLPEQIQYLSRLKSFYIKDFDGIADLPEWFGKLISLEILAIFGCENLTHLSSANEMRKLTSLRTLQILGCPLLKERCKPPKKRSESSEWHKISHISHVYIP